MPVQLVSCPDPFSIFPKGVWAQLRLHDTRLMTILCVCYGITISVKVLWMVHQSGFVLYILSIITFLLEGAMSITSL